MALHAKRPSVEGRLSGDEIVVHLTGRDVALDYETAYRLADRLLALADDVGESDMFLDWGNVAYLTCAALTAVVRLHRKLLAAGRHLTVGNLQPQVHEVFAITKLDRLLDLRLAEPEDQPGAPDGWVRPLTDPQDRWLETWGKGP
jgi:anti-sigma B factor antagonist